MITKLSIICPNCGKDNNYASSMEESNKVKPKPDDIGICGACLTPFIIGDDLIPRITKPEEMDTVNEILDKIPGLDKLLSKFHEQDTISRKICGTF